MSLAHDAIQPSTTVGGGSARAYVFVGGLLLATVTLKPFADLSVATPDAPVSGQDLLSYIALFAVAAAGVAAAQRHAAPALAVLNRPVYYALAGWTLYTALISYDPSVSLKRLALFYFVAAAAATLPLLPRGREELIQLLTLAIAVPVALSYFGVVFLPHLAVHSFGDTVEPELAGDWRGVYAHKNIASQMFGFFAYFGLYLWRVGRIRTGALLGLASVVFLWFTGGKTSLGLWLPAGLLGLVLARTSFGVAAAVVTLAPPVIISGLGFGAQVSSALASLASALPFDATFTGRADVWRYAAQKIQERPLAGRGFDSFWDDPALRANTEQGWVAGAAHAHNGFVDATLAMGLVGLALTLWAFVVLPLMDVRAAGRRGADPALTALAAQIFVYGLWVSALETFLYDRANPTWFLFLFAVFTLRYLACFRVAN